MTYKFCKKNDLEVFNLLNKYWLMDIMWSNSIFGIDYKLYELNSIFDTKLKINLLHQWG